MIFLGNLTLVEGTKYRVGLIHKMPFDPIHGIKDETGNILSQSQLEKLGVLVDSIPEPNPPEGQQVGGIYIDILTKEITYEYVDIPQTQEETINTLKQQLQILAQTLTQIQLGGV